MAAIDRFKTIPIDKLVAADWNYKEDNDHTRETQEALVENLKRNGQIENILVRDLPNDMHEVINGNHRLKAFKKAGITEAVVFDFGEIPLKAAQRIAIETNETKFPANDIKLGMLIESIAEEYSLDDLRETMPYDLEELEAYKNMSNFDWDAMPAAGGKGDGGGGKMARFREGWVEIVELLALFGVFQIPDAVAQVLVEELERIAESQGLSDAQRWKALKAIAINSRKAAGLPEIDIPDPKNPDADLHPAQPDDQRPANDKADNEISETDKSGEGLPKDD